MFSQPSQLKGRKPLAQIRMGLMRLEAGRVAPDTRKGLLSLLQDPTGMVEFLWTSGAASESALVFPGEATLTRITKCTTGRAYVLDLKSRQVFFWSQEKLEERDEDFVKLAKRAIDDKAKPQAAGGASAAAGSTAETPSPGAAEATQQRPNIELSALQNILSSLGAAGGEVDLQDMLSSAELRVAVQEDPAFYMQRLHEHMPPGTPADADIQEQLRNPQASSAAAVLQAALSQPDGFREICAGFSIGGGGSGLGSAAFVQRLIDEAKKKQQQGGDQPPQ